MPKIKVGDINMYYEVHGKGEPLLLIAGLGLDLTTWQFQIPEFSKRYQVIAFDNRGGGRTDAPDVPYSIRMMADDTIGLMDALGIDTAHILGLSMGGFIAQKLAIECPGRAKTLILAATTAAPAAYHALSGHYMVMAWAAAMTEGISPKTIARTQLPYLVTSQFFEKPEMVTMWVEAMAANPYRPQAHAYARQLAGSGHDTRGQLKQITAPTLVLVGKEDIIFPVKLSEELAALIPKAKLLVLEGGAHAFWIEIREKFNRAVLEFLGQIA